MVTDATDIKSTTATEAEIAAAAQEAQDALLRQRIKSGDRVETGGMPELRGAAKPMQYRISPADEASWVMVWELKLDADGQVYGDPTRAPRQQLGLWLQKKREDGGPRFTVQTPARLRAEATIPCLYNGQPRCTKKFYTRQDMVEHVDVTHPRFARINATLLESIMKKVAEDNPNLARMAEAIANMEDPGMVSVAVDPAPRADKVDVTAGAPIVTSMGVVKPQEDVRCFVDGCGWPDAEKVKDWSPEKKRQFLHTHTLMKHKDELD